MIVSLLGGNVHFVEKRTGDTLKSYSGHLHKEFRLNSVLDGECKIIVSGSEDGRICYWPLEGGDMMYQRAHKGPVMCIKFSMREFIKDGVLQTDLDLQARESLKTGKQLMLSVGSDGSLKAWHI